jgi:hypothetical protein
MLNSRSIILLPLLVVGCLWAICEYQNWAASRPNLLAGPDVIVGDIPDIARYGTSSGQTAFSVATTSCNIGTAQLAWQSSTNQHPVISQNMYRVKNGRIEMIGMSWLKHGFTALQQSLCGTCIPSGSGSWLGIGCSDPYSASLNGSQGGLGPRSEVNATTGAFTMPHGTVSTSSLLNGRIRVFDADLNPSLNTGARYFVESMYVAPDDAQAGNGLNNASYREAFVSTVTGGWDVNVTSAVTIKRQEPAINAWKAVHSDVRLFNVDVPGDGRYVVGVRTTPVTGGYHTEIAIENLNSHQSARSLAVNFGSATITNPGFRDVDYQFEPYSGTDWTPQVVQNDMTWSTQTFTQNQNANALRWNTLYSFWCDSALPPRKLTLGMFRPGTVSEISIDLVQKVAPLRMRIAQGTQTGGLLSDIATSNNQYLKFVPGPAASPLVDRSVTVLLRAIRPASSMTDFAFRLEAAMLGGPAGDVKQKIELFNFSTGVFEQVDERAAATSDQVVEITPTAPFSRFVEAGTNEIRARIKWSTPTGFAGAPFNWSVDIDEAVWLISN